MCRVIPLAILDMVMAGLAVQVGMSTLEGGAMASVMAQVMLFLTDTSQQKPASSPSQYATTENGKMTRHTGV